MTIRWITPVSVQVSSESQLGLWYDVDLAAGTCSCRAGQRGRACKHLTLAQKEAPVGRKVKGKPSNGREGENLTKLGYRVDEVASALQKEIRRGDVEAAVYWTLLLHAKAPRYAWKRVLVTAAEDVGLAAPEVVHQVGMLAEMYRLAKEGAWYVSPQHLTMAVVLLCRAPKSTEIEDLQTLTLQQIKAGVKREMPAYALDAHTQAGKARKAPWKEWYAARHGVCGVPVNAYTERLWAAKPEWDPRRAEE